MSIDLTYPQKRLAKLRNDSSEFMKRSKDHLRSLNPRFRQQRSPCGKCMNIVLDLDGQPDPDYWSLQFGQIISEFEKVLDNATYQVAIHSGVDPNDEKTVKSIKFPICDTVPKWDAWVSRSKVWLQDVHKRIFHSVQPIVGCWHIPETGTNTLVVLDRILNLDKHRQIHFVELDPAKVSAEYEVKFADAHQAELAGTPRLENLGVILKNGHKCMTVCYDSQITGFGGQFELEVEPYLNLDGIRYNLNWCLVW